MDDEFMEWLNEEAKRAGSIRKLAARIGVSHTTVTDVINGTRRPTFEFCAAVARGVGVPPERVFRIAGLLPTRPDENDAMIEQFLDYWASMNLEQRKNILRIVWAFYMESQGVVLNLDSIRGPAQNDGAPAPPAAPDAADP